MATQTEFPIIATPDDLMEETKENAHALKVLEEHYSLGFLEDEQILIDIEQKTTLTRSINTKKIPTWRDKVKDKMKEMDSNPYRSLLISEVMRLHNLTDASSITKQFLENSIDERAAVIREEWAKKGLKIMTPEELRENSAKADSIINRLAKG